MDDMMSRREQAKEWAKVDKTQLQESTLAREYDQSQKSVLMGFGSKDVRKMHLSERDDREEIEKIECDERAWQTIREKAGTLVLAAPQGVAIGTPVQKEPAEDKKQRKDRLKKLDKINKNVYGSVSYRSVVLQEKADASRVSREKIAKQREKDRKKGIDEKTLQKEDAKQNLIRAFSHDVRTDRLGKPIDDENAEAQKNNEAFKNNMEGHMSQVVQWVYQVNLNPQKLQDAYVKDHSVELFQTAERLKTFFDYYNLMGNEEWERGFLNDGAIVGERGKEILGIKALQAQHFRDLLSDKFKTVLSVDMETGKFLTDEEKEAFANNLSASNQESKKKALQDQCRVEQGYYQRMVSDDIRSNLLQEESDEKEQSTSRYDQLNQYLNKGHQVKDEQEKNTKRYEELSKKLNDSENSEVKEHGEVAQAILLQINAHASSFNQVYTDLDKYMNLNYANQTVLGQKLQEIVNLKKEELREEMRRLNGELNGYEEVVRFLTEGGKISSPTTLDILDKAGYPADALVERVYTSKGGIVDQSNETGAMAPLFGGTELGEAMNRLVEKSVNFDFKKNGYADKMQAFVHETIHTGQNLNEYINDYESDNKSFHISGRNRIGTVTVNYQPVDAEKVLEQKESGELMRTSDGSFVGAGMNQATYDYVNCLDAAGMYDSDEVMRYFSRMKELVGGAKVFQVKDKNGNIDREKTNRKFTAYLMQDYTNRYIANTTSGLRELKGNAKYTPGEEKRREIFEMITFSLRNIAQKDATGENYDRHDTFEEPMYNALEKYRAMADRVAKNLG